MRQEILREIRDKIVPANSLRKPDAFDICGIIERRLSDECGTDLIEKNFDFHPEMPDLDTASAVYVLPDKRAVNVRILIGRDRADDEIWKRHFSPV